MCTRFIIPHKVINGITYHNFNAFFFLRISSIHIRVQLEEEEEEEEERRGISVGGEVVVTAVAVVWRGGEHMATHQSSRLIICNNSYN